MLLFKVLLSYFSFHLLFVTFKLFVEFFVKFSQLLLLRKDELVFVGAFKMFRESGRLARECWWIGPEALILYLSFVLLQ